MHEQRMNGPPVEEQALKVTYEDRSRGGRGRGCGGFHWEGEGEAHKAMISPLWNAITTIS